MTSYPPPSGPDPSQQPQYGQGQSPYGPAPGYQPPPGYGYPQPSPGTNGMAIAGFVLAFFCSILGLIFSIIGLNQIKQTRQGGRGLAIAGIVISCASIVFGVVYFAANAGNN